MAALADDPRAALDLGCRIVATAGVDERRHAEIPFEIARNGDRTTVWYAAEAYAQKADGRAARWMAEGAASLSDPDGIVVDHLTLPILVMEYDVDRWTTCDQDWRIAVHCDDPARATVALNAAEPRLYLVANDGSVQPDGIAGLTGPPGPWYTPNHVAVDEDAPLIRLDCKSGVFPLMARTVLEIVIEELRAAGVTQARLTTPRIEGTTP
ncbi:hypothetical protein [Actinacidiphila yeochonensis]|uniref:hypothetical protein n=1 Tax=Actinacidiphila yeochonensis TaxID=89050 RepID=UPI0005698EA0|nr:hypothetical protein [Actinacidiphila yeochonensis]